MTVQLSRGDRLLLFTDGITEVRSRDELEFSEEKLAALARTNARLSASALTDQILAQVRGYCDDHFEDDATLLVIAVH